ncbi:MAG TPA: serine/threonine-protein kinase [Bryobacteraceae bacterium]|nr:serine/threonine-protein kinase [Bryobacteraceae bacterium]
MLRTKHFGNYEVIRKLARGMTDVYLAFDNQANRHAVLKIVEESPDPLTQLILEAERRGAAIQKQLHDADSRVIEVYEYGELDGYFFVAMQYIEGRTVAELLKEEKRIEPARAARLAQEILSQLDQLHSFQAEIDGERRAVVHGDIKPSNIQIGNDDEVRLLDFGIAKVLTFTHSRTHLNLGSPGYCSPERLSRGQVDRNADLWAVGVTLYEMVAGSPPYQAQDTRKLEELIQSRRPPRALPNGCPAPLIAILNKALAGDLHQRYVSAASFETDLRSFLLNRPTIAETERRTAWNTNPTVEKPRPHSIPERVSVMAETVRQSVMKLKAPRAQQLASLLSILVALCWGLLAGLVVCVPAGYYYRFWRESTPFRGKVDYVRASTAGINADWDLFRRLQRQNAFLGEFSPAGKLAPTLRASLLQAADDIIDRYRNNSDPAIENFDWQKAVVSLRHALEIDHSDHIAEGKLALANGYVNLIRANSNQTGQRQTFVDGAQAKFVEASTLIPRSPDPHLGLARIYVYYVKNVGKAMAELHEAQRLGFQPGPREAEQEADGYRFRANAELAQAQKYRATSRSMEERYLRLAQRDFARARELYEPILGFSNVNVALHQVDDDDLTRQQLDEVLQKPPVKVAKAKKQRKPKWRLSRWQ